MIKPPKILVRREIDTIQVVLMSLDLIHDLCVWDVVNLFFLLDIAMVFGGTF